MNWLIDLLISIGKPISEREYKDRVKREDSIEVPVRYGGEWIRTGTNRENEDWIWVDDDIPKVPLPAYVNVLDYSEDFNAYDIMVLNNKDSTAIRADYCKSLEEADKLAKELYDHYKELGYDVLIAAEFPEITSVTYHY